MTKRAKSKVLKDKQRKNDFKELCLQRQIVSKYVFATSFNDKIISEVVELETSQDIDNYLVSQLSSDVPQMYFPMNEGWRDGLVLISQLEINIYQNMLNVSQ